MTKTKLYIIAFLLVFTFLSCEKEEKPITPYDRGNVISQVINTGENGDYSKQVFYDLETNSIIKTVDRTSWDLAFKTGVNEIVVLLNSANKMLAANLSTTNFDSVTSYDENNLTFNWDHSSGLIDSMALKDVVDNGVVTNNVYIIDRGENPDLSVRGVKKFQLINATPSTYTIKYANIDGSNSHEYTISKNQEVNHVCFSFDNSGSIVDIEPNKTAWDLLFSQYTYSFYVTNPPLAYSVNGTLLNPHLVEGAKVFGKEFNDVNLDDVFNNLLSDTLDVIGYNWKYYNMDLSKYTIYPLRNYLIKSQEGFYYKLRFVDFYDGQGIKGNPTFEIKKI